MEVEVAESYIFQLKEARGEEATQLIQQIIDTLEPIASDDPKYQELRKCGIKIIKSHEASTDAEFTVNRFMLSIFFELFEKFKIGFKLEIS